MFLFFNDIVLKMKKDISYTRKNTCKRIDIYMSQYILCLNMKEKN